MPDQTLAQRVRAKYPGVYDDLTDQALEAKVKAKYPGVYDDVPTTTSSANAGNRAKPTPETPGLGQRVTNWWEGVKERTQENVIDPVVRDAQIAKDVVVGAGKGAANTGIGLGELAHQGVPGVAGLSDLANDTMQGQVHRPGDNANDAASFGQARAMVQPTNTAQQVGFTAEQMAEFFAPAGAAEKGAAWITQQLGGRLKNAPQSARVLLDLVPRMWTEALAGGTLTAAQGGNPIAGATLSAAGPVAGRVVGTAGRGVSNAMGRALHNPNPLERAAVTAAEQANVPVNAATASGSPYLKTLQKRVSSSMGGAPIAEAAKQEEAAALTAWGTKLSERANQGGAPQTAISSAEGVTKALKAKIDRHVSQAEKAYGRLQQYEEQAAQFIQRNAAIAAPPSSQMAFTKIPLAVDITPTKAAMQPVYDGLKREAELVPLMGDKARALTALDRLMNAPDMAPLSVADAALGELKSAARVDDAFRRTAGQGVAAEAVKNLEAAVSGTARRAGKDVYQALMEGRAATVAKHETIDVLDLLSNEPGRAFKSLTANKDTSLETLRAVQKMAPGEMPKVARAYLEGLMETATAEGSFGHADKLWAEWQKLGPETKRILFPSQQHVRDLDNFFLYAKKAAENPNPSGTAHTLTVMNVGSTPVMWGLAKVLYSPGKLHSVMALAASGKPEAVTRQLVRFGVGGTAQGTRQ